MSTSYNRIAGQSVERLAALSVDVFAVAMTLLVPDLRAPRRGSHSHRNGTCGWRYTLGPRLAMCAMTFMTLGIFWVGQQTQLNHLTRSERSLTGMHIVFLFAVSMMPFSTMLLAGFMAYRVALLVYWLNLVLLGGTLFFTWVCAQGLGLVRDDISPAARCSAWSIPM